jgi:hypothetical protein
MRNLARGVPESGPLETSKLTAVRAISRLVGILFGMYSRYEHEGRQCSWLIG